MKNNWQTKKLSEVCDFQRGLTYSKKDETEFSDNVVLRSNNIDLKSNSLNLDELRYIKNKIIIPDSKKVKKGSIIICTANGSRSHLGKIALIDKDYGYAFGGFMGQLIPKNEINSKYFFYILISDFYKKHLAKISSGANINNLKFSDLSELQITIPSISEQKRIVKILDEIFEKTAKAKENAEKNLQNAKELFESYLQSVFANPGKDWEEKTFDEIVGSNVIGVVKNTKEQSASNKYKYVKMNNITRDNSFNFSKYTRVNASRSEVEKCSLIKGDFLFNTRNSYELVGKTCIFEGDDEKDILFNNNIMRVRFIKIIISHFINYAFSSKTIIDKIKHFKSGTTNVSAIYYKDLKNLMLFIPSLSEQKSIVKKLDALSAETKKLEAIYKQKLADLEELKKSVLKKAFNGDL